MTSMAALTVSNNNLTSLDVSQNSELLWLDVRYNDMESYDDVIGWWEIGLVLFENFLFVSQDIENYAGGRMGAYTGIIDELAMEMVSFEATEFIPFVANNEVIALSDPMIDLIVGTYHGLSNWVWVNTGEPINNVRTMLEVRSDGTATLEIYDIPNYFFGMLVGSTDHRLSIAVRHTQIMAAYEFRGIAWQTIRNSGIFAPTIIMNEFFVTPDGNNLLMRNVETFGIWGRLTRGEEVTPAPVVPIVVIPGIAGSEFKDSSDEQLVWLGLNQSTVERLALNQSGVPINGSVHHVDDGYGTHNTYRNLIRALRNEFGDDAVHFFAYDWRLNNEVNADRLRHFIHSELGASEVDIVAHSMGGLIAARYIADGNGNSVRTLITLGTPFLGAPKVPYVFTTGNLLGLPFGIGRTGLRNISSHMISAYQLLPIRNPQSFIYQWASWPFDPTIDPVAPVPDDLEFIIDSLPMRGVGNSDVCHDARRRFVDNYHQGFLEGLFATDGRHYIETVDNHHVIVGQGRLTVRATSFHNDGSHANQLFHTLGDGTVPYWSADPFNGRVDTIGVPYSHTDMVSRQRVINQVIGLLRGSNTDVGDAPSNRPFVVIHMASPVEVHVTHNGETLSSREAHFNAVTDFGSLHFIGPDGTTEVLALFADNIYDILITGTGEGTMDYSIRFYDANIELVEERIFQNVPVTYDTVITTDTDLVTMTTLNVDRDGDGEYVSVLYPDEYLPYVVTFNAAGGTVFPSTRRTNYGETVTLPTTPIKLGYVFLGWNTEADGGGIAFTAETIVTENITVYARWELDSRTYTITFVAEGAEGVPESQIKQHDIPLTLTNVRPTRDNERFIGWQTTTEPVRYYPPGGIFTANENTTLYAVWFADSYIIAFNANGGTAASVPSSQIKVHDVPLTLSNTLPTRAGHYFLGWATSNTANVPEYQPEGVFERNEETTLYAVWQPFEYTVTFDANGGEGAPEPQIKLHGITLVLSDVQPTREGFVFWGWNTNRTALNATHQPGGNFTGNAHTTFYAVWRQEIVVSFDANGGVGEIASQDGIQNVTLVLTTETPTREGFVFWGWNTNRTALNATHQPGGNFTGSADTTLFAVWRELFDVSFNANGGVGEIESQVKIQNVNLALTTDIPTREGFAFLGWSTNSAATLPSHQPGGTFTGNANTVFYAVWSAITETISVNTDFPVSITQPGQIVIFRFTPTVSGTFRFESGGGLSAVGNVYTPSGVQLATNTGNPFNIMRTFEAGNTYYLGARLNSATAVDDFTIRVRTTYVVSYNTNGGSGWFTNQTKINGIPLTLSNTRPTRTGFNFLGWATSSDATSAEFQPSDVFAIDANTVLYAVWGTGFIVTFNANGGSGAPINQIQQYGVPLVLRTGIPTRTGFTFNGWATTNDATEAQYQPGGTFMRNETTTLFAVWSTNVYVISFDANGGVGAPESQTRVRGTTLVLSDVVPTRAFHTFRGWSTNPNAVNPSHQPGGNFTANGDTTLFAVWQPYSYTITFNVNGGSGSVASQTKLHDVDLVLRANRPTRQGHTFLGWATSNDATVPEYQPGGIFTRNEATTLFAVWRLGYTITFDATGGTVYPDFVIVLRGQQIGTLPIPTRNGYTFTGWFTTATAGVQVLETRVVNASATFFARWVAAPTIRGDINGDGRLTSVDTTWLARWLAENGVVPNSPVVIDERTADVNNDGRVDGADLVLLARYLLGHNVTIPE